MRLYRNKEAFDDHVAARAKGLISMVSTSGNKAHCAKLLKENGATALCEIELNGNPILIFLGPDDHEKPSRSGIVSYTSLRSDSSTFNKTKFPTFEKAVVFGEKLEELNIMSHDIQTDTPRSNLATRVRTLTTVHVTIFSFFFSIVIAANVNSLKDLRASILEGVDIDEPDKKGWTGRAHRI
jgi:hypothetical protein